MRVKDVARKCGFQNEHIRDHSIKTMINNGIGIKAMRKNWSVDEIQEEAELDEEIGKHAEEIGSKLEEENSVRRVRRFDNKHKQNNFMQGRAASTDACSRCGINHGHGRCPADGSKCHACGKYNHFARVCGTKKKAAEQSIKKDFPANYERSGRRTVREQIPEERRTVKTTPYKKVKHVTENRPRPIINKDSSTTSSDDDLINYLKIHKTSTEKKIIQRLNDHNFGLSDGRNVNSEDQL